MCRGQFIEPIYTVAACNQENDSWWLLVFSHYSLSPHPVPFCFQVMLPVLSNKKNHESWPHFVSQDTERHVEVMKNKIFITNGILSGRTLLPIPMVAVKTDLNEMHDENK